MTLYIDNLLGNYGGMSRNEALWGLPFSSGAKLIRASHERHGGETRDGRMDYVAARIQAFTDSIKAQVNGG